MAEAGGRFLLAKVNMDESPNLAQALQIRSIPAVKLIVGGRLQDEFMGALPEAEVRAFLERNLAPGEDRAATATLDEGDSASAEAAFRETLEKNPQDAKARVGLGHVLVDQGQWAEAQVLTGEIEEDDDLRRDLTKLRAKILLQENAGVAEEARSDWEADPGNLEALFALACRNALSGEFEAALEGFFTIVQTDRKFKEDAGRRGMLAVFEILPEGSPLDSVYRGKLSSLLFS